METQRALPPSLLPLAAIIQKLERILVRNRGFLLQPIEVSGPDVARDLAIHALSRPDRPCVIVEPGQNDQAWDELPATLIAALGSNASEAAIVLLVPPSDITPAVHRGLRLLNQRRDTIIKTLNRPLLWCGSAEFLNMVWTEAPDFWSVRAIDLRLVADEESNAAAISDPPFEVPDAARAEIVKWLGLRRDARAQHDFDMATRNALRAVDQLLRYDAIDAAAQIMDEVLADEHTPKTGVTAFEIALRRAEVDGRQQRTLSAAAELGGLLARKDLPADVRGRAALRMGRLLEDGGDISRAEGFYRDAMATAEASRDFELLARAQVGAYGIAARTGRGAIAVEPLQEAEAYARRIGDRTLEAAAIAALAFISINADDREQGARQIDEAKALVVRASAESESPRTTTSVDIVVLTAVQDELDALLSVGDGGRDAWQESRDVGGFRYYQRKFQRPRDSFTVAAAWVGEMGQTSAVLRAQQLLHQFSPSCLAMCGICAGDRMQVSLGDIIVADKLFTWDEGKRVADPGKPEVFFHDLRSFDLNASWRMDAAFLAREIDLSRLEKIRPLSADAQNRWILHALHAHETEDKPVPTNLPDRAKQCPDWTARLRDLVARGLVIRKGSTLALTESGRDVVDEDLVLYPDGLPPPPPLRVHVGALATVSSVTQDPTIFENMRRFVRSAKGLDMEGAAIAEIAARFDKRALVVKAVQDFADGSKDDTFRAFACKVAAEFLLAFLEKHFERDERHEQDERRRGLDVEEFEDPFLGKVERIAALRHPKAQIKRHRVDTPFAGVLEVEMDQDGFSEPSVVAALSKPISRDLVMHFATRIERPFRELFPYLRSTIVHQGDVAPRELRLEAHHRGIQLVCFREYQGLFDLTKYLDGQTRQLSESKIYPPAMYVDAPASYEVLGHRERTHVDNALRHLLDLLASEDQRRFALVLGEFGAGKTFLLRELARRMHVEKHPVWPVLVEMRLLEKRHDLASLLGAHFGKADVPGYNFPAFQYMLNEGRIALLFDGFDELVDRVTYDAVTDHFNTVLSAAEGRAAKVVLSSRRQHFLSENQVKLALTEQAQRIPGFRLMLLEPFGEVQIRGYLRNVLMSEREANQRYALLDEVKDLLGLSHNPRMLGFIARIPENKLREAKARGTITASDLYDLLVKDWLDFEHQRSQRISTQKGLSRDALDNGVTALALSMWHARTKEVSVAQIRDVLAEAMKPHEPALDAQEITHWFGTGSLLVRDADSRFSFVHRSVMEWLVARDAASDVREGRNPDALTVDEMSPLMVDFFATMAPREKVIAWARGKLADAAPGVAMKNATLVLQRLGESLARVDFSGQDLRGKDFTGVDWQGANLEGTNLEGATLEGANLSGANLFMARLERANLKRVNLSGANLERADLRRAQLIKANLSNAVGFDKALLYRTNLAGALVSDTVVASLTNPLGVMPKVGNVEPMHAPAAEACYAVAYDSAGELLAAGGAYGALWIVDAITGQLLRVLVGHTHVVNSVVFAPDGKSVGSCSQDQTVRIWDIPSGRDHRILEGLRISATTIAFCHNGKTIAAAASDNTVRLWDLVRDCDSGQFEGHANVMSMVFQEDNHILASGAYGNVLRHWDVMQGGEALSLHGHAQPISCIALSPDARILASGSDDKTIRLWDVESRHALKVLEGHSEAVMSVAFSPNGKTLTSGAADKNIRLWDAGTGASIRTFGGHSNAVYSVAFSPDGNKIASGSHDMTVRIWEASTGDLVRTLQGHAHSVKGIAFSPDGKTIASGADPGVVRIWNAMLGRMEHVLEGHRQTVFGMAFSPDGKTLASGSNDNTLRLWDTGTWESIRILEGHADRVYGAVFGPDSTTLVSGSCDKTVRVWDVASGQTTRVLAGHSDLVHGLAVSQDGKTIASASRDKTLRLWNLESGKLLRVLTGHGDAVYSVAFRPDGETLVSASRDETLRLWNVASGRLMRPLEGHSGSVYSVAFSPDGKTIASASFDKTVRLWDATSGREIHQCHGHTHWPDSVAFAPDGKTIASSSWDGTIRVWSVATGQCVAILFATPDGWVAYTPNGRYKYHGNIMGSFWHVAGLCRFEPGELDDVLPALRMADDETFF